MTNDVIADLLEQLVAGQARHEEGQKQQGLKLDTLSDRMGVVERRAREANTAREQHEKALEDVKRELREKTRQSAEDLSEFKAQAAEKEGALLAYLSTLQAERATDRPALEAIQAETSAQTPLLQRAAKGRPLVASVSGFTGSALAILATELARNPSLFHDLARALGLGH